MANRSYLVYAGDDGPHSFELRHRKVVSVGSDPRCSIVLDDPTVLPSHCELRYRGGLWTLIHLGGEVPTFLNGEAVDEDVALAGGDVLTVGEITLAYESGSPGPRGSRTAAAKSSDGKTRRGSRGSRSRQRRLPRSGRPRSAPERPVFPARAASDESHSAGPAMPPLAKTRAPAPARARAPAPARTTSRSSVPVGGIVLGGIALVGVLILVFALTRSGDDRALGTAGDPLGSGEREGSVISLGGGDGSRPRSSRAGETEHAGSELDAWNALDTEKIGPALRAGRLRDALDAVGSFRSADSHVLTRVAARRAEIEAVVKRELDRLTESTRTLVAENRRRHARDLIAEAMPRLPETLRAPLLALIETTRRGERILAAATDDGDAAVEDSVDSESASADTSPVDEREALRRAEAERLSLAEVFSASEASESGDGGFRVVWRFDRAEELDAFTARHPGAEPSIARGRLVISDEVRLLDGEPFKDRLTVSFDALARDPQAPNVNVALWTRASDSITFRDGATTSDLSRMRWKPLEPSDWALFGCGYRTLVCMSFERPFEAVYPVGEVEAVYFPANVVLAGGHGQTLHRDPSECLHAEAIGQSSPKWSVRVSWSPSDLEWEVNGRPIRASFGRLVEPRSREGSVSFVTNGRRVEIERLEIEADINPDWILARRLAIAEQRLAVPAE